jgi:ubiquinone/menaquinone biosynthesis C-methylase UbiE
MPDFDPEAFTLDSKDQWNKAAPNYRKIADAHFAPITEAFLSFAGLSSGMTVLDVACGPGTATLAAAVLAGPGGKVMGVDLAGEMLHLAARRSAQAESIRWREMNAESLDFPNETFDAVICQLGLMLFARPERALAQMRRVVKRAGAVSCLVQGNAEKMLFTSILMKALIRHAPELKRPGAPTLYAFGPEGVLERALRDAGLERTLSSRKEGTLFFPSSEDYWRTMTEGAGRTAAMLACLPSAVQAAVRADVLNETQTHRVEGGIALPYEVVMAKGLRP